MRLEKYSNVVYAEQVIKTYKLTASHHQGNE